MGKRSGILQAAVHDMASNRWYEGAWYRAAVSQVYRSQWTVEHCHFSSIHAKISWHELCVQWNKIRGVVLTFNADNCQEIQAKERGQSQAVEHNSQLLPSVMSIGWPITKSIVGYIPTKELHVGPKEQLKMIIFSKARAVMDVTLDWLVSYLQVEQLKWFTFLWPINAFFS